MDYKEKYNTAIKRAKKLQETCDSTAVVGWCEYIFPELKESEDGKNKRISKEITQFLKQNNGWNREWLAWLENQGKQKPYGQRKECEDCQFNYVGECKGFCQMKRDEQKHVDKVEPKFHPGDWIIDNEYGEVFKVTKADANSYEITTQDGEALGDILKEDVECNHRIWTIADAKDGDVLYLQHEGVEHVIMYKRLVKKNFHTILSVHCAYDGSTNDFFEDCDFYHCITSERDEKEIHPATKEQRDLLFQKMADAGYEFVNGHLARF